MPGMSLTRAPRSGNRGSESTGICEGSAVVADLGVHDGLGPHPHGGPPDAWDAPSVHPEDGAQESPARGATPPPGNPARRLHRGAVRQPHRRRARESPLVSLAGPPPVVRTQADGDRTPPGPPHPRPRRTGGSTAGSAISRERASAASRTPARWSAASGRAVRLSGFTARPRRAVRGPSYTGSRLARRNAASPAGVPGQCRSTAAGPAWWTTERSTRATTIASSA